MKSENEKRYGKTVSDYLPYEINFENIDLQPIHCVQCGDIFGYSDRKMKIFNSLYCDICANKIKKFLKRNGD